MSAWKLVIRELHARGPLRSAQCMSVAHPSSALEQAEAHGMATFDGPHPLQAWRLTDKGRAFAEGRLVLQTRVTLTGGADVSRRYVPRATWLASLPVGVRLQSALDGRRLNPTSERVAEHTNGQAARP